MHKSAYSDIYSEQSAHAETVVLRSGTAPSGREASACERLHPTDPQSIHPADPEAGAAFPILAGVLTGAVLTVGMRHRERPVTRADAIPVSAAFSSCRETFHRGRIREIIVRFSDHEQLTINVICLSDKVIDQATALIPGRF